ncbi:MAG: type VII toxin-antitoxin system MntA family adenylyltransferase antitoxin [Limnochordia bacterium]
MDRETIAEALRQYFATSADVTVAYLFGSVVRGNTHGMSDIDVGVLFLDYLSATERLFRRISFSHDLADQLGRSVDVVDLRETSPQFNHHVLRHKVVVKGHHDPARIAFEKDVRRHYFDMLPYLQRFEDASLKCFEEGGEGRGRRGPDSSTLEAARRVHQRLGGRPRE